MLSTLGCHLLENFKKWACNLGDWPLSLRFCLCVLLSLSRFGFFSAKLLNLYLEGTMLKLKLQYFGHLMRRADSLEKTLTVGGIEGRRRRG